MNTKILLILLILAGNVSADFKMPSKKLLKLIDKTNRLFPKVEKTMVILVLAVETDDYKPIITLDKDGVRNYGVGQVRKETRDWVRGYYNLPKGYLMHDSYCLLITMAYINILKTHYKFNDGDIIRAYGSGHNKVLKWKKQGKKGSRYLRKYQEYERKYYKKEVKK